MTTPTPSLRRRLNISIIGAIAMSLLMTLIGLGWQFKLREQIVQRQQDLAQMREAMLNLKTAFLIARQYDYQLIEIVSHNLSEPTVTAKHTAALTEVRAATERFNTAISDSPELESDRQQLNHLLDQYQTTVMQITDQIDLRQRSGGIEQTLGLARRELWQSLARNESNTFLIRLALEEQAYLSTRRQEYIDNIRIQINNLQAFISLLPDSEQQVVQRQLADYTSLFTQLTKLDQQLSHYTSRLEYQTEDLIKVVENIDQILSYEQHEITNISETSNWIGLGLVLWMVFSSTTIFIVLGRLINRYFTKPLIELTTAAQRVAEGWRDTPIPLIGTDEIGDLARALARLTAALNDTIARLEERIDQRTDQLQRALKEKDALLVQEQRRIKREQALVELGSRLSTAHDAAEVYRRVVDALATAKENADRIGIYTREPDGVEWVPRAVVGYQQHASTVLRLPVFDVPAHRPFYIPDLRQHEMQSLPGISGSAIFIVFSTDPYPEALLIVYRPQPHAFTDDEIDHLGIAARLAEQALTRIRLVASLRQAKERAEETNRERSKLLARLDHDIRNPLNTIIALSENLRDAFAEEYSVFSEDLEKIGNAGRRLLARLNVLLDSAKIETGAFELRPEPFIFDTLLDKVLAEVTPLIRQQRNRLAIERPPQVGTIVADLNRLWQVLLYPLQFVATTTQLGVITLSVQRSTDDNHGAIIEVTISDTGAALSEEQIDALLTPFAPPPETPRPIDAGHNLALCYQLCTLMGGTFQLTSSRPRGVTFHIRIPVNTADETVQPMYPTFLSQPDVLVITKTDSHVLQAALEQLGWQVQCETMLTDAITNLPEPPTAILVDAEQQELAERILSTAGWQQVPVIWLTDNVDDSSTTCALWPGDPNDVIQTLQTVLSRRSTLPSARHILVIEDEISTRLIIRRVLESDGWKVIEAGSGQLGAMLWRITQPQLVILDLILPDSDGIALLREIRTELNTPVVIVTARLLQNEELEMLAAVGAVVLQKGRYRRSDLLELVRKLMQRNK
ncbi:response regulator [Chloroflexus sp. Y-396-1]|uniref:response regulator n=1 Tax=Chloroflexus sp. Y-396-1 TaxID=867845 RepID=UPI0004B0F85C|nr:response regulator [Chloroflexus sp. Y-396-1]